MVSTDKKHLRRFYRTARRSLPPNDQREHARVVAETVLNRLEHGAIVAAYLARDGEVDLTAVFEGCWQRGITVAVPVLLGRDMRFAAYRHDQRMRRNQFDIAEPLDPAFVDPDVVLTPLVAFDECGRRLGMGGGYYDRYFAGSATNLRIGIAHECQRARELPVTTSDIGLTAVVTENGWQSF